MLSRSDIYQEGLPAEESFQPFVDFALAYGGDSLIDLGCGYGAHGRRLQELGKSVTGLDSNPAYVERARALGMNAIVGDAVSTPFEDGEFDTALLFEVLEHIPEPERVLREALRISRNSVLVTVPNNDEYELLKQHALTYWHLVATDHVNFFTASDFEQLAAALGADATVLPTEPLEPVAVLQPGSIGRKAVMLLRLLKIVRPVAYNRLFCVFEKRT